MSLFADPSSLVLLIGAVAILIFIVHGLWFSDRPQTRKLKKNSQQDQAIVQSNQVAKVRIVMEDKGNNSDDDDDLDIGTINKVTPRSSNASNARGALPDDISPDELDESYEQVGYDGAASPYEQLPQQAAGAPRASHAPGTAPGFASGAVSDDAQDPSILPHQVSARRSHNAMNPTRPSNAGRKGQGNLRNATASKARAGNSPAGAASSPNLRQAPSSNQLTPAPEMAANGAMAANGDMTANGTIAAANGSMGPGQMQRRTPAHANAMAAPGTPGYTPGNPNYASTNPDNDAAGLETSGLDAAPRAPHGSAAANMGANPADANGMVGYEQEVEEYTPSRTVYELILSSAPDRPYQGEDIEELCNQYGFIQGFIKDNLKIYFVYENASTKENEVFRICSMEAPYYFPENMQGFKTSAIALYMNLPSRGKAFAYFKALRMASEIFVNQLGGVIEDQHRQPLTSSDLDQTAAELQRYDGGRNTIAS